MARPTCFQEAMSIPLRNELNQITNLVAAVEGDEDNGNQGRPTVSIFEDYLPLHNISSGHSLYKEFPVNYNGKT